MSAHAMAAPILKISIEEKMGRTRTDEGLLDQTGTMPVIVGSSPLVAPGSNFDFTTTRDPTEDESYMSEPPTNKVLPQRNLQSSSLFPC
jgi:hypothetical protein